MTQETKIIKAPPEQTALSNLSWDHSNRTPEAILKVALKYWHDAHGPDLQPNVCYLPPLKAESWGVDEINGIAIKASSALLGGQILLGILVDTSSEESPS